MHEKRAEREQEVRLLRGLEQFSESVAGALEDPSFETKQQVLRLVVDRIVVEDSRVVVHHIVPTGPVGSQTRHLAVIGGKLQPSRVHSRKAYVRVRCIPTGPSPELRKIVR